MTEKSGSEEPRKILVVGGDERNIPTWAKRAFTIEHVHGESKGGKGRLQVKKNPEAIVVVVEHVSHNYSGQCHELGRALDIPVLKARGGWASAVAGAAKNRCDWFVDAVQRSAESLDAKNPPQSEAGLEAVENAWKDVAEHERKRCDAATKRLGVVQNRLDKVEHTLERVRSGAQERVLAEVRHRASEIREQRDKILRPIADEVIVLSRALIECGGRLERIEERLQSALRSPGEG